MAGEYSVDLVAVFPFQIRIGSARLVCGFRLITARLYEYFEYKLESVARTHDRYVQLVPCWKTHPIMSPNVT